MSNMFLFNTYLNVFMPTYFRSISIIGDYLFSYKFQSHTLNNFEDKSFKFHMYLLIYTSSMHIYKLIAKQHVKVF